MYIGKIVSSASHIEYVCQVYGAGEVAQAPQPADYGFGAFVGVEGQAGYLVGAIYNTSLMNPEFGNLGPRLSPREELAVFSPDYLAEKVTLVAVVILGCVTLPRGDVYQGVPTVAASIDDRVRRLSAVEITAFHAATGGLRLGYLPSLTALRSPLAAQLTLQLIASLSALFPHEAARLAILGNNLAWRTRVEPVG